MPKLSRGVSAAVKSLHRAGAFFVLCKDKTPDVAAMGGSGYFDRERISVDQVLNHIRAGGNVGIEPISLGCGVVDVDGTDDKINNQQLSDDLKAFMTLTGGLGIYGSLSYEKKGSQHQWYKINQDAEAPLGRKTNGDPYKAGSKLYLGDETKGFDIRYKRTYVVVPYLLELAHNMEEMLRFAPPNPNWGNLIEAGSQHKNKKKDKVESPVDKLRKRKLEYYKKVNQLYLMKLELPDKGEGQFTIANDLGFKAGQEHLFNPQLYDQAKKWLEQRHLHDSRWEAFEKAYEQGLEQPVEEAKLNKVLLKEKSEIRRIREALEVFEWTFRFDETIGAIEFRYRKKEWNPFEDVDLDEMWVTITDKCYYEKTVGEGDDAETIQVSFHPRASSIKRVISELSKRDCYNPIRDFMNLIPEYDAEWGDMCWQIFEKLGVEKTALNVYASKQIWRGAYYYNSRRIFVPLRPAVILSGPQDIGKSAIIREMIPKTMQARLHGPHFDPSASEKERIEAVMGRIIVEMGEMQRYTAKTLEAYKAFSQRTEDSNVRLAYRRNVTPIKRTAWPVGTSNKTDCLPQDDSEGQGNTRLLPVACTKGFNVEKWINEEDENGVSNRMKVWAQVKYECEKDLSENQNLRMSNELRIELYNRLRRHAAVESTLEVVVQWLTDELDKSRTTDELFVKGLPISAMMHSNTYIEHIMGGRANFANSRALEIKLGAALRKSGLWDRKHTMAGKRWIRTSVSVDADFMMIKSSNDDNRPM